MSAFTYPIGPHSRRHGPQGYSHYQRYRPWLRDEFSFRCVWCLARECWGEGQRGFEVDHLIPQGEDPGRRLDYENLVYACATCNSLKGDAQGMPDPSGVAFNECLKVADDGTIEALNREGQILMEALRLDNRENTEYRRLLLEIIRLARSSDKPLYRKLMGYPEDLSNLSTKRPPGGNSKLQGVQQSFFARRQRDELKATY